MSDRPVRVGYIAGTGRSGSTLLESVLHQHPEITAVGELHYIWQRSVIEDQLTSEGVPFSQSPFWQAVMRRYWEAFPGSPDPKVLARGADQVRRLRNFTTLRKKLSKNEALHPEVQVFGKAMNILFGAIAHESGNTVILDSSKEPGNVLLYHYQPDIEVQVLHLVKHPGAVAHSWKKKRRRPEITDRTVYMHTLPAWHTAVWWSLSNHTIGKLQKLKVPYQLVRFEDFTSQPRDVLARILSFAGLDTGLLLEQFHDERSLSLEGGSGVSGNPGRFKTGRITIRREENWRSKLSTGEQLTVQLLTLPLKRKLGY